jgi:hypothetical protein
VKNLNGSEAIPKYMFLVSYPGKKDGFPDKVSGVAEIRFWYDNKLVGIKKVRNENLKLVHS